MKTRIRSTLPLTAAALLSLFAIHCDSNNKVTNPSDPPVIQTIERDIPFPARNQHIQFSVQAEDPDGDSLTYFWRSDKGYFDGLVNASEVTWVAPGSDGLAVIRVQVGDGDSWVTDSLIVSVGPKTEVLSSTFGGSNPEDGVAIAPAPEDGFYLLANTSSYGAGGMDIWWLRLNGDGRLLTSKTFGGNGNDWGAELYALDEGGTAIAGTRRQDDGRTRAWLGLVDDAGAVVDEHYYGTGAYTSCADAKKTLDDGWIIAGETHDNTGAPFVFISRTDASLQPLWSVTPFEGSAAAVAPRPDGSYRVAAILPDPESGDPLSARFTVGASGELIGEPEYDLPSAAINRYVRLSGGEVLSIGGRWSEGGHFFLTRYLSDATQPLWSVEINDPGRSEGWGARLMADGGVIAVGSISTLQDSDFDLFLGRINLDGEERWTTRFGGAADDEGRDLVVTADGYAIIGTTHSYGAGNGDAWFLRIRTNQLTE